jgi:hypothetical protein
MKISPRAYEEIFDHFILISPIDNFRILKKFYHPGERLSIKQFPKIKVLAS